jgi:hypothetical protein
LTRRRVQKLGVPGHPLAVQRAAHGFLHPFFKFLQALCAVLQDHAVEIAGDVAHDAGARHLKRSHRLLELCRQLAAATRLCDKRVANDEGSSIHYSG